MSLDTVSFRLSSAPSAPMKRYQPPPKLLVSESGTTSGLSSSSQTKNSWRGSSQKHPLRSEIEQGQHFIWLTYSVQVVKAKRDQRLIDKASKIG